MNSIPERLNLLLARRLSCAAAVFAITLCVSASASSLVQNGSFEMTSLSGSGDFNQPGPSSTLGPGISNVANWTVNCINPTTLQTPPFGYCGAGNPILTVVFPGTATTNIGVGNATDALYGPMPATSPDGGNFVAGDGDPNYSAAFSQTINGLTPGSSYVLSFYQAASQIVGFSGATTDQWQVTLGNQTELSSLMSDPSQSFVPWNFQTLTFQATSSSEVLTFLAVGSPLGAPPIALLDAVSLTSTPEPSVLALLSLGAVALIVVYVYRRKRAKSS